MDPRINFLGTEQRKTTFELLRRFLARGQDAAYFSHVSKDAQEKSTSFDTNVVLGGGGATMVSNEKPTKNGNYVG